MRDHANLLFLFRQLLARDLSSRYRATTLGAVWLLLQPLLMLSIYTLVFATIFKVRWGGAGTPAEFAMVLFAGLIAFNFFAEVLVASPHLVASQPNYVKKVVFPIEILAVVRVASAAFTALVGLAILAVVEWILLGAVPGTFVFAPLVILAMLPMLLGVAWLLAAIGVYVPDIANVAGLVASMLLFLSPIFFPASAIPESFALLVHLNPLVTPIEQLRLVAVEGGMPDASALAFHAGMSAVFAGFSLKVFRHLSKGFADVL